VLYPLSYGGGQLSIVVARRCLPRHLDERQYLAAPPRPACNEWCR
jgi:hypothetical protein